MPAKELYNISLFLDANLQAYYRLNSDGLLVDSKNGNTLTNNNSVGTTNGVFGECANLNASNKFLSISSKLGYGGGAYTMSCWAKLNDTKDIQDFVLIEDSATDTGIMIRYRSGGPKIIFNRVRVGIIDNQIEYVYNPGTSWHHYVFVYNGSTVYGYIDGSNIGSVAASGNGGSALTDGFYISRPSAYVNGLVDDVALFNRALTSTEISNLYNGNYPNRIPAVKTNWFL